MAILIGVIALAVIPNIQRSRESKDISQLDSIASAANAAIATTQTTGTGTIVIGNTKDGVQEGTAGTLQNAVYNTVAAGAGKMESNALSTQVNIVVSYNTTLKKVQVAACDQAASDDFVDMSGTAVACEYLTKDNAPQRFIVAN